MQRMEVVILKIEFELPQLTLEKQIEQVVLSTTQKAIEKYHQRNMSKSWFSIKEACEYIGISFNSFTKLRNLGLKVCEIDGIKRVSKKEIDRFLEENSF